MDIILIKYKWERELNETFHDDCVGVAVVGGYDIERVKWNFIPLIIFKSKNTL